MKLKCLSMKLNSNTAHINGERYGQEQGPHLGEDMIYIIPGVQCSLDIVNKNKHDFVVVAVVEVFFLVA